MKKLILSIAACLIVALSFGQENRSEKEITQKADARFAALKQQLDLTEEQAPAVKQLVTDFEMKRAANSEKAETLDMMFDEQLSSIVSSEQMAVYRERKAESKEKESK